MIDYILNYYENNMKNEICAFDLYSELNTRGGGGFEQAYRMLSFFFMPGKCGEYSLDINMYDGLAEVGVLYVVERDVFGSDAVHHTHVHNKGNFLEFKNCDIMLLTVYGEKTSYNDVLITSGLRSGIVKPIDGHTLIIENCTIGELSTNGHVTVVKHGDNIIGAERKMQT